MQIFCFIYPDAFFFAKAPSIVANITRTGVKIVDQTMRAFDLEEIKLIFHSRRLNADFEDFCKAMTVGTAGIIHFEGDLEGIHQYLDANQLSQVYIPTSVAVHASLLKLSDSLGYKKERLAEITADLRRLLAKDEELNEQEFSAAALQQGKRLYTYCTAMQIAGFSHEEAMALTKTMQSYMLYEDQEEARDRSQQDTDPDED